MAQYTPKTWTTGETITAAELNALEQAAAAAAVKTDADAAYDAKGAATAAQTAAVAAAATDATTKASAAQAAAVQRANHTGTQSADTLTDGTTNKAFLATERTKLTGVATGATANSSDAQLRDRSTHTGTQAATTVTGLATVATTGAYSDLSGKPTIPAAYTDAQAVTANAAAVAGRAPLLVPTATQTAAYTAAVGDLAVMNVAGGATALTLPTAPADKSQVGFRAVGATTAVPLVVTRGGTDTIGDSGATSVSLPLAGEVTVYQYQAASTRWLPVSNVKPLTGLDGRYATTAQARTVKALPGYWVSAFAGLGVGPFPALGAGYTSATTSVQGQQLAMDCTDLRVLLPYGWSLITGATAGDAVTPNGIPCKVSIQVGTSYYPVTFRGQRLATCDGGGALISDPLGGVWAKGTQIKLRILMGATNGQVYPNTHANSGPGINPAFTGEGFTQNSDIVDATTAPASNNAGGLWGGALLGRPLTSTPFVLGAIGDSITDGTGDTGGTGYSWITRAANATVPCFMYTRGGASAQGYAATPFYSMPMMSACTHAVVLLGANDIASRTAVQFQADATSIYRAAAAQGVKVLGATILPRTNSTDSWATTTNQTSVATAYNAGSGSIRGVINAWIRAGAGGLLAGYVETADAVESARDSGLWKPSYTADGLHPNATGHAAMAAAVNLTTIAAL